MQDDQPREIVVELAPALRGRLGMLDLIGPAATAHVVCDYDGLTPGRLFLVQGPNYHLECRVRDDCLELVRNGKQAEVPLAHLSSRTGSFITTILWSPEKLLLTINDQEGKREDSCSTSPSFPPHAIREWARRQALTPNVKYESEQILYEEVLNQLQHLRDRIVDANAINGFWNITYDGNKIVSRKPKHETEIHPDLHGSRSFTLNFCTVFVPKSVT